MSRPGTAQRITRSYTMTIDAPPEEAFRFMCPQREHEYLEDWHAEILFSESGFAEAGCIFTTRRADDPAETTWVICEHDQARRIVKFVMHTPGSRVGRLTVSCGPLDEPDRCAATFTYEITALTPHGRAYLEQSFTAEQFETHMRGEEKALNHYLATGEMLRS